MWPQHVLLFLQASVDSSVNGVHLLLACLLLGLMVRIEEAMAVCGSHSNSVTAGWHLRVVVHYLTRTNASVIPSPALDLAPNEPPWLFVEQIICV